MRNYKRDSTTTLSVVCAVIFVFTIFTYLYSFQGDILGMMQYAWSDHQTHYDRLTGGLIFTAIACVISLLCALVTTLPERTKAFVYMPAMALCGMVTGGTVDDAGNVDISWGLVGFTVLLLLLYPYMSKVLNGISGMTRTARDGSTHITTWWSNILVMILLTVMMFSMGNTDRSLHTRLAVERLCHEGKYEEALEYGIPKYDHDEALPMWRAYALARLHGDKSAAMGERLFNYNIQNAQVSLLPAAGKEPHALLKDVYPVWQAIGFVPRKVNEAPEAYLSRELRRGTARTAARDYLLCTYLVRKDLPAFAERLVKYYDKETSLPQHYAEALLICRADGNVAKTEGLDSLKVNDAVKADYHDFLSLLREKKPMKEKQADIRDNYFGTYWYYYYRR